MVYQRAEFVGPKVSGELLMNGIYAVVISMAGVFAYLWFRFEWQYGIGAIAALVHDVSATIAIYSLFGIEFNLTSVAAVLTLVGYSLNDTVVIYDRVRENLRRYKTMAIEELLDRSINETLARTLMTSLTTGMTPWSRSILGGSVWCVHRDHDLGCHRRHLLHGLRSHAGALLPQHPAVKPAARPCRPRPRGRVLADGGAAAPGRGPAGHRGLRCRSFTIAGWRHQARSSSS